MISDRLVTLRSVVIAILVALAVGSALVSHPVRAAISQQPTCTITGTLGNDVLEGSSNRDVICGLEGNDTLMGLDGDDFLMGGPGADKLFGGLGSDDIDGGYGMDAAHFNDSPVGIMASLVTNMATGEGDDTMTRVENLTGSQKADNLIGSDSENTLSGKGGEDTLSGLSGTDKLTGGTYDDTLRGGAGADMVTANGGSDALFGDEGNDVLDSSDGVNGNDNLDGGSETDTCLTDAKEISTVNCDILPDTVSPSVKRVKPSSGAKGVKRQTNVKVIFSEVMRTETINVSTVRLARAGTTRAVRAGLYYDSETNSATLNPSKALRPRTKYKVVVSTRVRDLAGNSLDQVSLAPGNQSKVSFFSTRK